LIDDWLLDDLGHWLLDNLFLLLHRVGDELLGLFGDLLLDY
jgi:hypothetical protein